MLQYPTIPHENKHKDLVFHVFDKLDGSNIRAEYNPKRGFYKFGSRHHLIDLSTPILGESIQLIQDTYAKNLASIFGSRNATCFFEFYGKSSFAGSHVIEPHEVTLFDIHIGNKGFLSSEEFIAMTTGIKTAKLLYAGKISNEFKLSVINNELPGITFEGVVGKTKYKNKHIMFKQKTLIWHRKLTEKCNGDQQLFDKLK